MLNLDLNLRPCALLGAFSLASFSCSEPSNQAASEEPSGDGGATQSSGGTHAGGGAAPVESGGSVGDDAAGTGAVASGGAGTGGVSTGGNSADDCDLAPQCGDGENGDFSICFENVCGRAGETVFVDVFIRGPAGCDNFSSGYVVLESGTLALENAPELGSCIEHEATSWPPGDPTGDPVITWHAPSSCPTHFFAGEKFDTLELSIPEDATPGDVVLSWKQSGSGSTIGGVTSSDGDCGTPGDDQAFTQVAELPTIRILP